MNRDRITGFVRDPSGIPPSAAGELEEIVRLFPYFQGGHILLARAFRNGNDVRFGSALKQAALHAGDRAHLKAVLEGNGIPVAEVVLAVEQEPVEVEEALVTEIPREEPEQTVEPQVALSQQESEWIEPPPELAEADLLAQIMAYPEIQEPLQPDTLSAGGNTPFAEEKVEDVPQPASPLVGKERHSFTEWLLLLDRSSPGKTEPETTVPQEPETLIDTFIRTEPRISKPEKTAFFSPVNMARRSIEDKEDIVTETLARIYAEQGDVARAIRIYQKLSLQEPGKSRYFAALIEKLENPT